MRSFFGRHLTKQAKFFLGDSVIFLLPPKLKKSLLRFPKSTLRKALDSGPTQLRQNLSCTRTRCLWASSCFHLASLKPYFLVMNMESSGGHTSESRFPFFTPNFFSAESQCIAESGKWKAWLIFRLQQTTYGAVREARCVRRVHFKLVPRCPRLEELGFTWNKGRNRFD